MGMRGGLMVWGRGVRASIALTARALAIVGAIVLAGCGDLGLNPQPLFTTPLSIDDQPIGTAVIDTGGGYEVMLRDAFGLDVIHTAEVLAYTGRERVDLTESFRYEAGGVRAVADTALVGLSVCDCNGVGYFFLRKTGVVLGIDFRVRSARFLPSAPEGGVSLPFEPAPPHMGLFDSSFIDVELSANGRTRTARGLLDTGTNFTVMRRDLLDATVPLSRNLGQVTVTHQTLGAITTYVGLFDTQGLPDIILGLDVMRDWADEWYFRYDDEGGAVVVAVDPSR
jgi:hypothetical protein